MAEKTLFLAWHDAGENRLWFPVGRLDADPESSRYRFRYTGGAKRAQERSQVPFDYRLSCSGQRLTGQKNCSPCSKTGLCPQPGQIFNHTWRHWDDECAAEPVEILAVNGGLRRTDRFEVFPKLVKQP